MTTRRSDKSADKKAARSSLTLRRDIVAKARHGLHQALAGAVLLDHSVALGCRREVAAPGDAGAAAAQILEDHGLAELHRLDVVAAAVAVDDALGRHDLIEGDAVLIIAAVRAVHDETPDAARPELKARRRGGETVRPPPLRQMFCIGPRRKHQLARRIELADADDRARILIEIEATFYGHVSCPWLSAVWLAALSDRRRGDRSFPRRTGDSVRANRRYPSAPSARCGRGGIAPRGRA